MCALCGSSEFSTFLLCFAIYLSDILSPKSFKQNMSNQSFWVVQMNQNLFSENFVYIHNPPFAPEPVWLSRRWSQHLRGLSGRRPSLREPRSHGGTSPGLGGPALQWEPAQEDPEPVRGRGQWRPEVQRGPHHLPGWEGVQGGYWWGWIHDTHEGQDLFRYSKSNTAK